MAGSCVGPRGLADRRGAAEVFCGRLRHWPTGEQGGWPIRETASPRGPPGPPAVRPLCSFTSQEASKFETTGHHFQNPKTYPSGSGPGGPLQSLLASVWTDPVSSWVDSQTWMEDRSCWPLRPAFPRPGSQVKPPGAQCRLESAGCSWIAHIASGVFSRCQVAGPGLA